MAVNDETLENILEENKNNSEVKSFVSNADSTYEIARSMPSPRLIKTHFPLSLVPNILKSDCKVKSLNINFINKIKLFMYITSIDVLYI